MQSTDSEAASSESGGFRRACRGLTQRSQQGFKQEGVRKPGRSPGAGGLGGSARLSVYLVLVFEGFYLRKEKDSESRRKAKD